MIVHSIAHGGVPVGGGADPSTSLAPPGSSPVIGGGMDWAPDVEPEPGRCHHRKDDDSFCGRYPKKGDKYCPLHKRADEALDLLNAALNEE